MTEMRGIVSDLCKCGHHKRLHWSGSPDHRCGYDICLCERYSSPDTVTITLSRKSAETWNAKDPSDFDYIEACDEIKAATSEALK